MPGAAAADRRLLMEVEKGNLSGVKKLLVGGANIDGSSELEYRPIIGAARSGNATMLKLLISKGADLEVQARFPHGARALHAAIAGERPDALCVLLEAGADVDSKDGDGQTPLMQTSVATTNGAAMAQELLNALADPFARNDKGMTALHVAAGFGNIHIMRVILAQAPPALNKLDDSGFTPMGIAALKGKRRAVSYLLAAGASDRGVHEDQAALFWAAEGAHPSMVRLMLEYPIDSTGGLKAVPNAIGVAIQGGQAKILDMLLSVEGEEKRQKWAEYFLRGGYPLRLACAWVSFRAVHVLLSAGASETCIDGQGNSAYGDIGEAMDPYARDPKREAALRRMLKRGPAFRARSFAWTTQVLADAGGDAASASPERKPAGGVLGAKFYRPTGTRFFPTRFARYVKK